MKIIYFFILLTALSINSFAADRYWIATSAGNWSNTANWSTTSGGSGGASVPGTTDRAIFDANSTGTCNLTADVSVQALLMSNGTINTSTHLLTISGSIGSVLSGGTITGSSTLTITTTGSDTITFSGTLIDKPAHVVAYNLSLNGSTFNSTTYFEVNGTGNSLCSGGNTFKGNCELKLSNEAAWTMEDTYGDDFQGNLDINIVSTTSGNTTLYLAKRASSVTTSISGNLTINMSGSDGIRRINVGEGSAHNLNIGGDLSFTATSSGGTTAAKISNGSHVTVAGNFTVNNNPDQGVVSSVVIGETYNSSLSVTGISSITNQATGNTNSYVKVGNYGDITFNNDLTLINNGDQAISCSVYSNSTNNYNGNIYYKGTGDIHFGASSGGTSILANGKTISEDIGSFSGTLELRDFTQTGTTSQALTISGTSGKLFMDNATWGANFSCTAPVVECNNSTFSGSASMTQNGSGTGTSTGGNTFNGILTLSNTGSGVMTFGDGTADDCNSDVYIYNTWDGDIYFAKNGTGHDIAGNCYVSHDNSNANDDSKRIRTYLNYSGGLTIHGNLDISADVSGTGNKNTQSTIYLSYASYPAPNTVIYGKTTVSTAGEVYQNVVYLGRYGNIDFKGTVQLTNGSISHISAINVAYNLCTVTMEDNLILENTVVNDNGGVKLGNSGSITMSAGKSLSIGPAGYSGAPLTFINFTQNSNTAIDFSAGGITTLGLYHSTWNGNITAVAEVIKSTSCIYNGDVSFSISSSNNANGGTGTNSGGNNTFNGNVVINHGGGNFLNLCDGTYGNDYNGNLTINESSSGIDAGLSPFRNGETTISGDLTITVSSSINVVFGNSSTSWLTFDGSGNQTISISSNYSVEFMRIKVNKNTGNLILNDPVNILNNLDLTKGNIVTTSTNILTMKDGSVLDNYSVDSYVNGPMIKEGSSNFVFPLGGVDYQGTKHLSQIGISNLGSSQTFTASYTASPHPSNGNYQAPLTNVSDMEYWELSRNAGSGAIDVTLYWGEGTFSGVGDLNTLRVSHFNGTTWEDKGSSSVSGTTSSGSITATGISNFSPFTLASTSSSGNPLPVELLYFSVENMNKYVNISWQTASEKNNDHFVVERSKDTKDVEEIATVKAAGNSNVVLDYKVIDDSPFNGLSYYRLVQVDFDGQRKVYPWKSVFNNEKTNSALRVFPNPSDGNINLALHNISGNVSLYVYDMEGRMIFNEEFNLIRGGDKVLKPGFTMDKGLYTIVVKTADEVYRKKITVIR